MCEKGFYTPVGSETGALYKNQREAARSQQWSLADNPQGNSSLMELNSANDGQEHGHGFFPGALEGSEAGPTP